MNAAGLLPGLRHPILRHPALRILALFVSFCAISSPLLAWKIHDHRAFSPIDEVTYLDYVHKVDRGHFIVQNGDRWDGYTIKMMYCRGNPPFVRADSAACTEPVPPASRRNTADIDPPTYYLVTALAAHAVTGLGLTHDLLTAARVTGILWAGAGLTAIFILACLLGAGRTGASLASGVALFSGGDLTNWYHVTPHATDLFVGASVAIAVLQWSRRRVGHWALIVAGALPVAIKASSVLVGLIALLALLLAIARPGVQSTRRRNFIGFGITSASLAAGALVWVAVRHHYALTNTNAFPKYNVSSVPIRGLLSGLGGFTRGPDPNGLSSVAAYAAYASVIVVALDRSRPVFQRHLASATATLAVLGPSVLVLATYILAHQYVASPLRYGLSIYALALAFAATLIRDRWTMTVGVVLVAALLALQLSPYS